MFQTPGYPRRNQHAGFKVLAGRAVVEPSSSLVKVKAHQDLTQEFQDPEAYSHALGNAAADKAAKRAATSLCQPSKAELDQNKYDASLLRSFLMYVARVLPKWPALATKAGKKSLSRPVSQNPPIGAAAAEYAWDPGAVPPPPRPPRLRPSEAPGTESELHRREYVNGQHICTLCRVRAKSEAQYLKRLAEKCPGYCAGLASLAQDPRGHNLLIFEYLLNSSTLILCRTCGSYSETGTRGSLFKGCLKRLTTNNARSQVTNALELRHPKCGRGTAPVFKPPVPLELFYRQAVEEARAAAEAGPTEG